MYLDLDLKIGTIYNAVGGRASLQLVDQMAFCCCCYFPKFER